MNNRTIPNRLLFGFVTVISIFLLSAGIGLWCMQLISNAAARMERSTELLRLAGEWKADVRENSARLLAIAYSDEPALFEVFKGAMQETSAMTTITQKKFYQLALDPGSTQRAEAVGEVRRRLLLVRAEVFALKSSGNNEGARALIETKLVPGSVEYVAVTQKMVDGEVANVQARQQEIGAMSKRLYVLGILLFMASLIVAAFIGWSLSKYIAILEDQRLQINVKNKEVEAANLLIQKKVVELERVSDYKSDFLARMSHEIRTPMNAIIGMSQLALKHAQAPKLRNYLDKIILSANNLLGIIDDILDFSKIEAGKMSLEQIPFALNSVLDHLASVILFRTESKGLETLFRVDPDVPLTLIGDPLRLGQVLINLTGNAVKFTEQGEILIGIELLEQTDHEVKLLFYVQDTGIGMTASQLQSVFQSFSQADSTITRRYGGTGLGLAISRQLVEMMGGQIVVESKLGVGSKFSFELTLGVGNNMTTNEHVKLSESPLAFQRVLVVDDNEASREILKEVLTSFGCHPESACSGKRALEMLVDASKSDEAYDLVLMDWRMPGWDGIETTRRLQEDERLSKIPAVLMVTAYTVDEFQKESQNVHVDGILNKPINSSLLYNTLAGISLGKNTKDTDRPRSKNAIKKIDLSALHGARILLVEDFELNREVAIDLLTESRVWVDVAMDGQEAIDCIQRSSYDLVLMDIQMPIMDGLTATKLIRAMPEFEQLPIIAMTAHAMTGDRQVSLNAGMNDHIVKPIDSDKMFAAILRWIDPIKLVGRELPVSSDVADSVTLPELPLLPNVDWQIAYERVNHNPELLLRLIRNFKKDYGQVSQLLEKAVAEQRFDDIRVFAHNLKSSASYLGMASLGDLAAVIENSLRKGNQNEAILQIPHLLDEAELLLVGLNSINLDISVGAETDPVAMLDLIDIARLMKILADLLKNGDSRSEDAFRSLQKNLPNQYTIELEAILYAIDDIEFDEALALLNGLADKMFIQLER